MTKILAFLCLPLAVAGIWLAVHAGGRVHALEAELAETARASRKAGQSFVETLRGEHAERQRIALDRRREVALELASARRDRLLGVLATAGAVLLAGGLVLLGRIAAEIEADRRHVAGG